MDDKRFEIEVLEEFKKRIKTEICGLEVALGTNGCSHIAMPLVAALDVCDKKLKKLLDADSPPV